MAAWDVDLDKRSIGPFQIGMTVYEAHMSIQRNPDIQSCNIIYHEEAPFAVPLIFFLRKEGIRLEFDSVSQVLVRIVVTEPKAVTLSYENNVFSGPACETTMDLVYLLFRRTILGKLDKESNIYELPYPNLSFMFYIPPEFHSDYEGMNFNVTTSKGISPLCTSMIMKASRPDKLASPRVRVVPGVGVFFNEEMISGSEKSKNIPMNTPCILLGDTLQTVVTFLGAPDRSYVPPNQQSHSAWKEKEKERADKRSAEDEGKQEKQKDSGFAPFVPHATHSAAPVAKGKGAAISLSALLSPLSIGSAPISEDSNASLSPSFFYNYFRYGIDVYFSGATQRVQKIILHSNLPGHPDFCVYSKCGFVVEWGKAGERDDSEREEEEEEEGESDSDSDRGRENKGKKSEKEKQSSSCSPSESKSDTVITELSHRDDLICFSASKTLPAPVVNSRPSTVHPFGTSYSFGFACGVIFEVTKNGFITSVCIFE